MTTDTRLGMLEGRADEQAAAIADLRAGQREIMSVMNSRFDNLESRFNSRFDGDRRMEQPLRMDNSINSRIDGVNSRLNSRFESLNSRIDALNSRIDRMFLAMLGIGAAQIALLITLVLRI